MTMVSSLAARLGERGWTDSLVNKAAASQRKNIDGWKEKREIRLPKVIKTRGREGVMKNRLLKRERQSSATTGPCC